MKMLEINAVGKGFIYLNPTQICSVEWVEVDRSEGTEDCYLISMSDCNEYRIKEDDYPVFSTLISDIEYYSNK